MLFESVRPLPEPAAGWADVRPPYHGLPGQVIIDAARLADGGRRAAAAVGRGGDRRGRPREDLPVGAPDERVRPAGHLGPAGPRLPGHRQGRSRAVLPDPARAAAGRAARLQGARRLPARQEPRAAGVLLPARAGADRPPAGPPSAITGSRTAVCACPRCRALQLSPLEMFAHGAARAGFLQVPARADLVFDFLKVEWRTIQHYGVEIGGLRYDGPALNGHRNQTSPYGGKHAGRWPLRVDPGDVSRVWFQDPDDEFLARAEVGARRRPGRAVQQRGAGLRPPARRGYPPVPRHPAGAGGAAGAVGLGAGRRPGRAADGAAPVRAAAAPGPGHRRWSRRHPEPASRQQGRMTAASEPAPRSPARSPAVNRAISTPTRWRPCEHAAAARRARLLAVHPLGLGAVRHRPAPAAARPADRRADPRAARAGAGGVRGAAVGLARQPRAAAHPADARRPRAPGRHRGSQPAGRGQGQGRRGDRRLPRAGQVDHRPGLRPGVPPAAGQPLRPAHRAPGTTGYPSRTSA